MEWVSTVEKYERRGIQQGLKLGREEGREEGMIFAYRRAILQLAAIQGMEFTTESRERLQTCTSAEQLERWLTQVGTASAGPIELEAEK